MVDIDSPINGEVVTCYWCMGVPAFKTEDGLNHFVWRTVKPYKAFIERDTIVNLEVTGEELALIYWLISTVSSGTDGCMPLWHKLNNFDQCHNLKDFIVGKINYDYLQLHTNEVYKEYIKEFFTKAETDHEKSIRETKDEIEKAKKALEDAESKLKGLLLQSNVK